MPKTPAHSDVLVLGEHPAAYLASALLRHKSKLHVLHSTIPGETFDEDRLVLINPALYRLHELTKPLERKLECHQLYGVEFLGDQTEIRSEYHNRSAVAGV